MIPPLISYVTFNRLGLTVKSLTALLDTTDDFELHIIDNKSTDGTWQFIQSLNDSRIKTRTHININAGLIYSLNINLSKRRPEQYFITLDNDVCIETKDWISKFFEVFEQFPEVGLLGVENAIVYPKRLPPIIHRRKKNISYIEIENAYPDAENNCVPGCLMCIRPELLNEIGYFSEENGFGTIELCYRINNYTDFKTGFVSTIKMKMPQNIECSNCIYADKCILDKDKETCLKKHNKLNKNDEFMEKFKWKFDETVIDMESGARPVYCASANDGNSTSNNLFNMEWSMDNFDFYIKNAN